MKPFRSLVAAVAAVALLAACAPDDGPVDDSAGSGGEAVTIRYTDVGAILASYPRLQAETAGYFADQGVTLNQVSTIANANQLVQAVAQGQADMALTGGTGPLAAAGAGRGVTVVAVVGAPAPLQLALTTKTLDALAAKGITKSSPIADKFAALKGMKIATFPTGSTTDLLLRNGLKANGVEPDRDLTIQPFGDAAALIAAAKQGASDGLVAFPNQSTTPGADGWGDVFIDFLAEAKASVDVPYIVVIANNDFVKNSPDTVKKFLQALVASRDDAKNMTAEKSAALKAKFFAESSDAAFQAGLTAILPAFAGSIVPTQTQADNLLRVYNQAQAEPIDPSFESIYNTEIVGGIAGA